MNDEKKLDISMLIKMEIIDFQAAIPPTYISNVINDRVFKSRLGRD